jgi:hypothetical protein
MEPEIGPRRRMSEMGARLNRSTPPTTAGAAPTLAEIANFSRAQPKQLRSAECGPAEPDVS